MGGVDLPRGFESLPLRWRPRPRGPRAVANVARVSRPLIGLCAAVEDVSYRVWNESAVMLPRAYAEAVSRAGGLAALLPPDDGLVERPDEVLDSLDGVVPTLRAIASSSHSPTPRSSATCPSSGSVAGCSS